MSKESSFDIVSEFDFQELRNAIEQVKKETATRYDLKGANIEIELSENEITIIAESAIQIQAVESILLQKMINRKVSPQVLDHKDPEQVGGNRTKKVYKLIKALDQENAKKISKLIRDNHPKVKPNIQGDSVRVTAKSKDDLQAVMSALREAKEIQVPLQFTNYR